MRKTFAGYYRPTEKEISDLWNECIFSLDANVLLHIYRYTPKTRDELFKVLEGLKSRIWLPYQVVLEYHKDRVDVIKKLLKSQDDLIAGLGKNLAKLGTERRREVLIDDEGIISKAKEAITNALKELKSARDNGPDWVNSDPVEDRIAQLFDGKIGSEPLGRLDALYEKAEGRFKNRVPPGYGDVEKPRPDKFGDALIWFELLDYAKTQNKPLIFVTDDIKEDWWRKSNNETLGPRPELIKEMLEMAKARFYMYTTDEFISRASRLLNVKTDPKTVEEIRDVRRGEESAPAAIGTPFVGLFDDPAQAAMWIALRNQRLWQRNIAARMAAMGGDEWLIVPPKAAGESGLGDQGPEEPPAQG